MGASRTIFVRRRQNVLAAPLVMTAAAGTATATPWRSGRSAIRHVHAVASGDHAPDRLARFRIDPQRFIFHALPYLKPAHRLFRIDRFVDVGGHKNSPNDYSPVCRRAGSFGSAGFSFDV